MNFKRLSAYWIMGGGSLMATAQTLHVDTVPDLRLNPEAVKAIQFNFSNDDQQFHAEPIQSSKKPWMEFKVSKGIPRTLTDTAQMKKPEGYVRIEPYTIWTSFGEDPVYDVLYNLPEKKWEIKMDLPGPTGRVRRSIGTVLTFDANKLLFENFTKRGRAIKHNRKHANAWKTYRQYLPTKNDVRKFPTYFAADSLNREQQRQKQLMEDSITLQVKQRMEEMKRKRTEKASNDTPLPDVKSVEQLIMERRKQQIEQERKMKERKENVYDIKNGNMLRLKRE